jgi:hypothetical protein
MERITRRWIRLVRNSHLLFINSGYDISLNWNTNKKAHPISKAILTLDLIRFS